MRYLWTEDTGAGLHFWKLVNKFFFDNELVVESKGSNQGLLDAVIDLDIKDDDKYYVAFDYVVDNQDIRNKYRIPQLSRKAFPSFLPCPYFRPVLPDLISDYKTCMHD